MNKGFFISFEGTDGSGKTTQIKKLKEYLETMGQQIVVSREPGGTEISEAIRSIILAPAFKAMCPRTEALLFAAARAQHVFEKIKPYVENGVTVLCDRFVDSSMAYQAFARGLGEDVWTINAFAIQDTLPDVTFYLDIDAKQGKQRNILEGKKDRLELETMSFYERVTEGYRIMEERFPERFVRIDASLSPDEVFFQIKKKTDELFNY